MNNLPEVLAPASDLTSFRFALRYGADAVYVGGNRFGMRRGRVNFSADELTEAVSLAKKQGKKVYYTLNTTPMPEETDELCDAIPSVAATGVDAFIVADIGVMQLCKKLAPAVDIHISTQAGVTNELTANALHDLGASRVVLARELSCEQIAAIRAKTPKTLSIECFVHGAMCMAFSGRCLISHYLADRNANNGACFQPCRTEFLITDPRGDSLFLGEEESGGYILNAHDLCMAQLLDLLQKSGVDSFKIEGRSKSFYYVASVTSCYRRATDRLLSQPFDCGEDVRSELLRTSHRPHSTGFYLDRDGAKQSTDEGGYIKGGEPVAVVEKCEDGRVFCVQRGKCFAGESLNILTPDGTCHDVTIEDLKDEGGNKVDDTRHAMMKFSFDSAVEVEEMSILRRVVASPKGFAD